MPMDSDEIEANFPLLFRDFGTCSGFVLIYTSVYRPDSANGANIHVRLAKLLVVCIL